MLLGIREGILEEGMVRQILKGHLSRYNNCSSVSPMDKGALTPRWTCNLSLPSVSDGQSPVLPVNPPILTSLQGLISPW